MNILHITGMPYPTKYGGVEKWFVTICEYAAHRNDKVFIAYQESVGNVAAYSEAVSAQGANIIVLRNDDESYRFCIQNRISIVHFHFGFEGERSIFRKLNKLGVRQYLHLHSENYYCTHSEWRNSLLFKIRILGHRIKTHFTAQYFSKIFACSNAVRQQYCSFYKWSDRKCITLYLGIPVESHEVQHYNGNDVPVITCVAFHSPIKGVDVLLQALYLLKKEKISFICRQIGGGSVDLNGEDTLALHQLCSKLGLDDYIEWIGITNNVLDYLQHSDIYCQPSRTEALSLSIVEAMYTGLPIVASNVGGIPELVNDGVNGDLVDADDAYQLASALKRLLLDPVLRKEMGIASSTRLKEMGLTTQRSAEKLWEFYNK